MIILPNQNFDLDFGFGVEISNSRLTCLIGTLNGALGWGVFYRVYKKWGR